MSPGGWHSQGGIGDVGSADQGAAEAGQGPSRGGRAAAGRRAARLGPGAGDVHAGSEGPGPGLHPGRVRKRGESACARAGPAPPGRAASHAGDDGRHTRRPARVHRPDRRRRVDGLDEPGRLTVTAAASTDWTEAVAKPEETPGPARPSAVEFREQAERLWCSSAVCRRTIQRRARFRSGTPATSLTRSNVSYLSTHYKTTNE